MPEYVLGSEFAEIAFWLRPSVPLREQDGAYACLLALCLPVPLRVIARPTSPSVMHEPTEPARRVLSGSTFDGIPFQVACTLNATTDLVASSGVYIGELSVGDRLILAIKVLGLLEPDMEQVLNRELKAARHAALRHPLILAFLGTVDVGHQTATVSLYMRNGNLVDYLKTHPDCDRKRLILQVAEAVKHLHTYETLVHGNLKCANVLISDFGEALLADLGLSTFEEKFAAVTQSRLPVGFIKDSSIRYAAPELFLSQGRKTFESDVYAFGMLIIEAYTLRPPWDGKIETEVIRHVSAGMHPSNPSAMSNAWWEICERCWSWDSSNRPTIDIVMGALQDADDRSFDIKAVHGQSNPTFAPRAPDQAAGQSVFGNGTVIVVSTFDYVRANVDTVPATITSSAPVGAGAFATVYKGMMSLHGDNIAVALKIFSPLSHPVSDESKIEILRRELETARNLCQIRHPSILPFIGTAVVDTHTILVAEFMSNGNMLQYLRNNPQAERRPLIIQIARAILFLHKTAGIVHGDIKCENVLISDKGEALLADFGLSTVVEKGRDEATTATNIRLHHTTRFAAPELLDGKAMNATETRERSKSTRSDVYAFGMLMLQTFTGKVPWPERNNTAVTRSICFGEKPSRPGPEATERGLTDRWWLVCLTCWVFNQENRPTMARVVDQLTRGDDPASEEEVREEIAVYSADRAPRDPQLHAVPVGARPALKRTTSAPSLRA